MSETLSTDISMKNPLPQLWEAFKDLHNLLPRLLPGYIEGARIVEGDGGVGSIRECWFGTGVPGISSSKEVIEVIDEENHIYMSKVLESEILETFSSYEVTWEFKPQVEGPGTHVKYAIDFVPGKEKAKADKFRDSGRMLMKQLEGHLLATGEYSQPSRIDKLREEILS